MLDEGGRSRYLIYSMFKTTDNSLSDIQWHLCAYHVRHVSTPVHHHHNIHHLGIINHYSLGVLSGLKIPPSLLPPSPVAPSPLCRQRCQAHALCIQSHPPHRVPSCRPRPPARSIAILRPSFHPTPALCWPPSSLVFGSCLIEHCRSTVAP